MNWTNCPKYNECLDERKDILTYCDVGCSNKHEGGKMNYKWERHNAPNGEHIWQGARHIADIVTDVDKPEVSGDVTRIAQAAILMYNDPKYKAAPDMYEALKAVGDLLFGLPENESIKKALAKAEGK